MRKECPYIECNGCGNRGHILKDCKADKCDRCKRFPKLCVCVNGFLRRNPYPPTTVGCNDCGLFFCNCKCSVCGQTTCTCACYVCETEPCQCNLKSNLCSLCRSEPCVCPCQDCNSHPCSCDSTSSQEKDDEVENLNSEVSTNDEVDTTLVKEAVVEESHLSSEVFSESGVDDKDEQMEVGDDNRKRKLDVSSSENDYSSEERDVNDEDDSDSYKNEASRLCKEGKDGKKIKIQDEDISSGEIDFLDQIANFVDSAEAASTLVGDEEVTAEGASDILYSGRSDEES